MPTPLNVNSNPNTNGDTTNMQTTNTTQNNGLYNGDVIGQNTNTIGLTLLDSSVTYIPDASNDCVLTKIYVKSTAYYKISYSSAIITILDSNGNEIGADSSTYQPTNNAEYSIIIKSNTINVSADNITIPITAYYNTTSGRSTGNLILNVKPEETDSSTNTQTPLYQPIFTIRETDDTYALSTRYPIKEYNVATNGSISISSESGETYECIQLIQLNSTPAGNRPANKQYVLVVDISKDDASQFISDNTISFNVSSTFNENETIEDYCSNQVALPYISADTIVSDGTTRTITKTVSIDILESDVVTEQADYANHPLLSALTYDYNTSSVIPLIVPISNKWGNHGTLANNELYRQYYTLNRYADKILPSDETPEENSYYRPQASELYDTTQISVHQDVEFFKMNGIADSMPLKDYIINSGKITGFYSSNLSLYPINDSTAEFLNNGVKYIIKSSDTNKLNMRNINNFSVYFVDCDTKPDDSKSNTELYIDYIGRNIHIFSYNNAMPCSVAFEDINGNAKNSVSYTKTASGYKLKDLYVDSSTSDNTTKLNIVLGDNEFTIGEDNVILYTESVIIDVYKGKLYSTNDASAVICDEFDSIITFDKYCSTNDEIFIYKYAISSQEEEPEIDRNLVNDYIDVYVKNDSNNYNTKYDNLASIYIEHSVKGSNPDIDLYAYQENLHPIITELYSFITSGKLTKIVNETPQNHLKIYNIGKLSQYWFKKYSDEPNYCYQNTQVNDITPFQLKNRDKKHLKPINIAIDYKKEYNIMSSPFDSDFYKRYTKTYVDENVIFDVESVAGYTTGILQKNFINSVSVNMKNKSGIFTVSSWVNTKMVDGIIYFNLTNSIIRNIFNNYNFNKLYNKLNIRDNTSKMNMIKNTILPNLKINTKNTIIVYGIPSETISFNENESGNILQLTNIETELINENGIYWVKLIPSNVNNYKYYIKYNIEL